MASARKRKRGPSSPEEGEERFALVWEAGSMRGVRDGSPPCGSRSGAVSACGLAKGGSAL